MQKKEGDWGPEKLTATHPRVCREHVVYLGACNPRLPQECAVMALTMSFGTWTQEGHRIVMLPPWPLLPVWLLSPSVPVSRLIYRTSQQLSWGGASAPGVGASSSIQPCQSVLVLNACIAQLTSRPCQL